MYLTETHTHHKGGSTVVSDEETDIEARKQTDCQKEGCFMYLVKATNQVLTDTWINFLILATPFAFAAVFLDWSQGMIFTFSLLALIPFAAMVGFFTEELATRTNDTFGGFLNATFGNAAELIISAIALRENLLLVVQVSLLGSILSNLLLVLGTSLLVGGVKYPIQTFNRTIAALNAGMLTVSVMGMLFPAVLHVSQFDDLQSELALSHYTAVVLLATYISYLFFQLKTHTFLFEGEDENEKEAQTEEQESLLGNQEEEGEGGGVELTTSFLVGGLAVITFFISILSEYLVVSIEGAADDLQMPKLFIAAIIIPIVGNAAEHVAAVTVAYHNKIEITLGITVGSSTQIALFVTPIMVLLSWAQGKELTMNFHMFEVSCCFAAVLLVSMVCSSGKTTWLTGLMLVMAYLLMAGGFFIVHNRSPIDPEEPSELREDF